MLRNELHAWINGKYMTGAIDNDIASGVFGLGSYRSALTYKTFGAAQP